MENFNKYEEINWEKFRAYVASKMLCACFRKTFTIEDDVNEAVEYADKLIAKLKSTKL